MQARLDVDGTVAVRVRGERLPARSVDRDRDAEQRISFRTPDMDAEDRGLHLRRKSEEL